MGFARRLQRSINDVDVAIIRSPSLSCVALIVRANTVVPVNEILTSARRSVTATGVLQKLCRGCLEALTSSSLGVCSIRAEHTHRFESPFQRAWSRF